MKRLTLAEIKALPVIEQGHTDNLVFNDGVFKVWHSRLTAEDGEPCDDLVTVEAHSDIIGGWVFWEEYDPRNISSEIYR